MTGVERAEVMVRMTFGPNHRIRFSPDGALLAVCSAHHVEIADTSDGRVLRLIRGHAGTVADAAFSPDGTLVVSGSADETARVWDAATGAHRATFECDDGVNALAVSPDGTVVATTTTITASTWELATGLPEVTVNGGGHQYLGAVAFAPSGALLGLASTDKTATIWDAVAGIPVTTLSGHGSSVTAIAFSPAAAGGRAEVATASLDGTARTWDAATGRPGAVLSGHTSWIHALAYAPSGAVIATGSGDHTARTWDAATGAALATMRGHSERVKAVSFAPDGSLLATASTDRTARTWDPRSGALVRTFSGHDSWVEGVACSARGLIATASWDETARVWDAATGKCLATLVPLPSGGYITLLPDASYKLGGDPGGRLWWASGLSRLGPDEAGSRFPEVRRLPPGAPSCPARPGNPPPSGFAVVPRRPGKECTPSGDGRSAAGARPRARAYLGSVVSCTKQINACLGVHAA